MYNQAVPSGCLSLSAYYKQDQISERMFTERRHRPLAYSTMQILCAFRRVGALYIRGNWCRPHAILSRIWRVTIER
jgi:hypothetical protein